MRNKGFTMLEMLISLFLFSYIVDASVQICTLANRIDLDTDFLQDINAIYQLRMILVLAEAKEVNEDAIYYRYDDDVMTLSLNGDRLMIQPGTNIVMDHLDYVWFERGLDDYIYMYYIRGNKERRVMICR